MANGCAHSFSGSHFVRREMTKQQLQDYAEAVLKKHGLAHWSVEDFKRGAGECDESEETIYLNLDAIILLPSDALQQDIVLHEVAHALDVRPERGHDEVWAQIGERIGMMIEHVVHDLYLVFFRLRELQAEWTAQGLQMPNGLPAINEAINKRVLNFTQAQWKYVSVLLDMPFPKVG
jgi:hypothetical protein